MALCVTEIPSMCGNEVNCSDSEVEKKVQICWPRQVLSGLSLKEGDAEKFFQAAVRFRND